MPRKTYPTEWTATGHGSYREIREGEFQLRWRSSGAKGPRQNRIVVCTEIEAHAYLIRQAEIRSRASFEMPTAMHWKDAKDDYRSRLEAKNVGEKYREQVMDIIENLSVYCGGTDVNEVRPVQVQTWIDERAKALKTEGWEGWARTANKELDMAGGFFRHLARMRMIRNDPITPIRRFVETKQPPRDLSAADYVKVWKICEPSVQDLMDFYLITAARFEEVQELKRTDITAEGRWTAKDRKGHDYLRLVLPAELLEIVLRQPISPDGHVFHRWVPRVPGSSKGHGFKIGTKIGNEWWTAVLEARCETAKVEKFTSHDLRHAAGSWAKQAGCSPWYIQALLGHADIKTTMIYAHGDVLDGTKMVQRTLLDMRAKAMEVKQA